jgi:hypothetical protein
VARSTILERERAVEVRDGTRQAAARHQLAGTAHFCREIVLLRQAALNGSELSA